MILATSNREASAVMVSFVTFCNFSVFVFPCVLFICRQFDVVCVAYLLAWLEQGSII